MNVKFKPSINLLFNYFISLCTEHKESGMPGMSRYISTKNRKNTTERLELKKFNPVLKKVTVHKEIK